MNSTKLLNNKLLLIIMDISSKAAHHFTTTNMDQLRSINDPEYNLAILKRNKSEGIIQAVQELEHTTIEPIRIEGKPSACLIELTQRLSSYNFKYIHPLMNDIEKLVEQFVCISETSAIKIFFGKIETDLCKRFHTDVNDLRLLCTYEGIGTVWTENSNIYPKHCGKEELLIDKNNIHYIDVFHIAILKGALHRASRHGEFSTGVRAWKKLAVHGYYCV